MSKTTIIVTLEGENRLIELNPAGTFIGRGEDCDVVINCKDVSRRHARLRQDGRSVWTIEDLNSSNGTYVNGERVKRTAISAEDVIEIGHASLSFGTLPETMSSQCTAPNIIIEDFGTEVFYDRPRLSDCDIKPCPEQLTQIGQCLFDITEPAKLYRTVCELLAREPRTAAAVFRPSGDALASTKDPEVLVCRFGSTIEDAREEAGTGQYPSHLVFRVSHRLLETVVRENRPLMSKTIFSCDPEVTCSLIDEHSPRALICAPIEREDKMLDLLYVDVPITERAKPGPEEMFVFVQAVSRKIQSTISSSRRWRAKCGRT